MKVYKYRLKYKDGKRKRQVTFLASGRAAAMIGVISNGIDMANVLSLDKVKKK